MRSIQMELAPGITNSLHATGSTLRSICTFIQPPANTTCARKHQFTKSQTPGYHIRHSVTSQKIGNHISDTQTLSHSITDTRLHHRPPSPSTRSHHRHSVTTSVTPGYIITSHYDIPNTWLPYQPVSQLPHHRHTVTTSEKPFKTDTGFCHSQTC